jgi:hypothetical protein
MTDRRAALCAAIFLLEPYHLFYSLWLLGTTLFTTALLLTWIAWRITMKTGDRRWALLLGGLAGFDVLVRPIALLVPVAIGLGLLLVRSGARGLGAGDGSNRWAARRCRSAVVFALACAAVVGSWMMRNRWVAGHFALSHQGGVVLAYFKAAEVDLWREGRAADRYVETSLNPARSREGHVAWERIDRALRERFAGASEADRAALSWRNLAQGNHTKLDSFDISRELARIGRERLLDDPLSTLSCCLIRCGSLLTFPLNLALRPPPGAAERRWRFAAVGLVYLALVIAVFVRLARGGWSLAEVYFPIAVTLALLLATTPQLDPRFRVAMIPMLALLTSLPVPRQRESSRDAPTE